MNSDTTIVFSYTVVRMKLIRIALYYNYTRFIHRNMILRKVR
jgi:hypothetical protein